jgi:hypothetical protein
VAERWRGIGRSGDARRLVPVPVPERSVDVQQERDRDSVAGDQDEQGGDDGVLHCATFLGLPPTPARAGFRPILKANNGQSSAGQMLTT